MYEYDYPDPATYYHEALQAELVNLSSAAPRDKYVSVWQHDDASWIFSAVFMVNFSINLNSKLTVFFRTSVLCMYVGPFHANWVCPTGVWMWVSEE